MKASEIDSLLKNSPDPELAHRQWTELETHITPLLKKAGDYRAVMSLFGRSLFLVDFLKRNPEAIQELATSQFLLQKKDKHTLLKEKLSTLNASTSRAEVKKALRYFKYIEMCRILMREFCRHSSSEETGQELSCLASASVELAQQAHFQMNPWKFSEPCTFTTIGMGKVGGNDLNLSSDIDIIYLFDLPENVSESAPLSEIFQTLSQAAESITDLIQDRTEDGIVFRVDLELRPQGKSGPLINSLEAIMTYYEIAGASWERSALIKAFPISGDVALGQNFLKRIVPFVYRRSIDLSVVADLKKMKEKINAQAPKSPSFHLKLGTGGIREIEFFVSAFQLLYGGREILLRDRHTVKALKVLKELKLISAVESERLQEAYIFLRKLENYIQAREERQTHTLPTDEKELTVLAKMMGISSREELQTQLTYHTNFAAECFSNMAAS